MYLCRGHRDTLITYRFIYSSVVCVHITSAPAQHHFSRVKPIQPKDFALHRWEPDGKGPHHYTSGRRWPKVSRREGVEATVFFCVFVIWGFWKKESKASRTKSHSAGEERRGQPIDWESAVEVRPCRRHHRSRALRIAPVCKVTTIEGAQGERHQSNSLGRLTWMGR